ncbi:MAG: NAD(P)/FAD-dependent oxidoreductase [Candidatus Binatia bacterium]|nr:NAD(P)/FAD-dependent oxidoreductase [Candidatus Binatia bacterium]
MERHSIVIVGAGPAGTATALFLVHRAPELASEILLLDKAVHPRFKVCAGGLIPHTVACLEELKVPLDPDAVQVDKAVARTTFGIVEYEQERACTVVRRDRFDATLVAACESRGVRVRQGERVVEVERDGYLVRVTSERNTYVADIVVGADGAGSIVRRRIFGQFEARFGRAIMTDVAVPQPILSGRVHELTATCQLDFRPVAGGLRGYAWIFPCSISGALHWNVGVYASRAAGQGSRMKRLLQQLLDELQVTAGRVYAHPIPLFHHKARLASGQVLLVGDAVGVDPLLGEGISYAFEFGRHAAESILAAYKRGDAVVEDYERRIQRGWLGRKLRRLHWLEQRFYGWDWRLWFWLAARSERARALGLHWYNGVEGLDQLSVIQAGLRWWRKRQFCVTKRVGA